MTDPDYRSQFIGLDVEVPRLQNGPAVYINFDNAASTPPFRAVRDGVDRFLEYYASVHRGTGFKSQLSTWAYETARRRTLAFVGADPNVHTCIFGKNTTEAINKLARRLPLGERDVVLVSLMEHHSNDLPFRAVAAVDHVGLLPDGRLDEEDLDRKLRSYDGRVRLLAITGASNVTGYLNPVHRLAEKAHAAGARILVDAAQLAPHRRIRMGDPRDPSHLDFVALSAHKLYAPYGTGALIGPRHVFEQGAPDLSGGGTIEIVTEDKITWAEPPERDEAGSPNVVGAVALALAIRELEAIGMGAVAAHEAELTAYALGRMASIPGLQILGDTEPASASQRLGVIPFLLEGHSHFQVASILGHEFGIGVRSGCFCAHPYVLNLLGLKGEQREAVRARMLAGDRRKMPGMVRISFGLYNTKQEIDRFIAALEAIAGDEYRGHYVQEKASGDYIPQGWSPDFSEWLPL